MARPGIPAHGDWMQTHVGVAFDYRAPRADMIRDGDVARALAFTNRYNGHTIRPYSVAQHSLLVVTLVRGAGVIGRATLRQALVHDAPEAYVGDVVAPLKRLLPGFREIEERVWTACAAHYGVPAALDPLVKEADWLACRAEAHTWLQAAPVGDWAGRDPISTLTRASLDVLRAARAPEDWAAAWLAELERLS